MNSITHSTVLSAKNLNDLVCVAEDEVGDYFRFGEMRMFMHHIYEFKKGVRSLVLCTTCKRCAELLSARLQREGIQYLLQDVQGGNVNLYFGKSLCLDVVKTFINKPLNRLTPEQDFMLGVMLGYDISVQCERFRTRKGKP